MESEWRMNVWRLGLSNWFFELAAEHLTETGVYYCKVTGVDDSAYVVTQAPASWQPWNFVGFVGRFDFSPHFPWGWPVKPDRPP